MKKTRFPFEKPEDKAEDMRHDGWTYNDAIPWIHKSFPEMTSEDYERVKKVFKKKSITHRWDWDEGNLKEADWEGMTREQISLAKEFNLSPSEYKHYESKAEELYRQTNKTKSPVRFFRDCLKVWQRTGLLSRKVT